MQIQRGQKIPFSTSTFRKFLTRNDGKDKLGDFKQNVIRNTLR